MQDRKMGRKRQCGRE